MRPFRNFKTILGRNAQWVQKYGVQRRKKTRSRRKRGEGESQKISGTGGEAELGFKVEKDNRLEATMKAPALHRTTLKTASEIDDEGKSGGGQALRRHPGGREKNEAAIEGQRTHEIGRGV